MPYVCHCLVFRLDKQAHVLGIKIARPQCCHFLLIKYFYLQFLHAVFFSNPLLLIAFAKIFDWFECELFVCSLHIENTVFINVDTQTKDLF